MADSRPFVAICLPCQDNVKAEFAISLAALSHCSNVRMAIIRGSSSIVTSARNLCLEQMAFVESQVQGRGPVDAVAG